MEVFNDPPNGNDQLFAIKPLQNLVLKREAFRRARHLEKMRREFWSPSEGRNEEAIAAQDIDWEIHCMRAVTLGGIGADSLLPSVIAGLPDVESQIFE